ncbi:hypothetical protein [Comamonas terrigena]|uniref:hypothetical protein n=1 Tax=Comamonas terrigena TaxID=32013 RepID=UPI0023555DA8|nr:hypothetical protein [Comamonas terrigena]
MAITKLGKKPFQNSAEFSEAKQIVIFGLHIREKFASLNQTLTRLRARICVATALLEQSVN